MDKKLSVPISV